MFDWWRRHLGAGKHLHGDRAVNVFFFFFTIPSFRTVPTKVYSWRRMNLTSQCAILSSSRLKQRGQKIPKQEEENERELRKKKRRLPICSNEWSKSSSHSRQKLERVLKRACNSSRAARLTVDGS